MLATWVFAECRTKSYKNAVFFAFFANFVQSVSKNVKTQCFLTLFAERRAKTLKNAVIRIFCETMNKVSRKT